MLRFLMVCGLLALGLPARAATFHLDYLRAGSLVFSNVMVIGANATDLYFSHDKGIANVKLKYLEPDLQKRFRYDPKEAAAAEIQQAHEDSRYQGELAASIAARQAASLGVTNHPISSPDSPADPVSDKALIGKAAPALEFEKWIGRKPELKDKFVLVCFWEGWSIPSRKFISQFNGYQKQFADKLQVIGAMSEQPAENATAAESLQFPIGLDSKGKFSAACGITSIPSVVLMDPQSTVLYAGHPAALNDKTLQTILTARVEKTETPNKGR